MLPEERARVRIDKQLSEAGWDIVARNEYAFENRLVEIQHRVTNRISRHKLNRVRRA